MQCQNLPFISWVLGVFRGWDWGAGNMHVLVSFGSSQEEKLNEDTLATTAHQSQCQNLSIISIQEEKQRVLGKEKWQRIWSQVLTHSYHRARLPRDPSRPLLRYLSKQKQELGWLWRCSSPTVTLISYVLTGKYMSQHMIKISSWRKDTIRWVSGVLGGRFDELTAVVWQAGT